MNNQLMNRIHFWMWIFSLSIACLLIIPILIQNGMFMDAVQYSVVSRNLAAGNGSFWNLQFDLYNIHDLPSFSEQPPLAFGIQSVFYYLIGDSIYTERIYTFICFLIAALLISKTWKTIFREQPDVKQYSWLPFLIWATLPIVFWSYRNNMLENTMTIFLLFSAIFIWKTMQGNNVYFNIILSSFFIFCATLTKGLPGLFTLSIPFLYFLVYKNISFAKAAMFSFMMFFIITILYLSMFVLFKDSIPFYERYFLERTLTRIGGEINNEGSVFIIIALLQQLIFPIIILLLSKIFFRKLKSSESPILTKHAIFFILLGLSGILPIMLTPVQKQFYMTPALPYLALGFSILILSPCRLLIGKLIFKLNWLRLFQVFTILLIAANLILLVQDFGKISRDAKYISDAEFINNQVQGISIIGSTHTVYYNWVMHSYLIRNHSIYPDFKNLHEFYLTDKRYDTIRVDSFKVVPSTMHFFELYKTAN